MRSIPSTFLSRIAANTRGTPASHCSRRYDASDAAPADSAAVVLLTQRGRFLVGEPFFERGRRVTVERSRDAAPGRLALVRGASRGGNRATAAVLRACRLLAPEAWQAPSPNSYGLALFDCAGRERALASR